MIGRAVFLLVCLISAPAAADMSGPARVIDGDTIVIGRVTVRLFGIDAPEIGQSCVDGRGRPYDAGDFAKNWLVLFLAGTQMSCARIDTDRYGRVVAACRIEETDIGETMVRAGMAFAYRRYSDRYVPAEDAARSAAAGLWAGTCHSPEEWRRAHPHIR